MPINKARIGELKSRLTFQYLSTSSDGQGGKVENWRTLKTVWAKVEPVTKPERLFAQQIQYQRSHKITIRYIEGLTTTMRIYDETEQVYYQIKGLIKYDARRFYMYLDAEINQGT